MPFATFAELSDEMFRLYGQGEYERALALINRDFENFTDHLGRLYFWRVCLHSVLGQNEEALRLLERALELGFGYAEEQLRGDSDLKSLQGRPEFERLVARSQEQYARLALNVVSTRLVIPPSPAATPPYPLLVVLHGNSSSAAESAGYWQAAAEQGWLILLPQSSQPGWDSSSFVWNHYEQAVSDIQRHYGEIRQEYDIDPERIVLSGFSRGGTIALSMVLDGLIPARGVIAAAAAVRPNPAEQFPLDTGRLEHMPRVYLIAGERDERFYQPTLALAEYLTIHDIPCELSVYPDLTHAYPPDFAGALAAALEAVMQT